MAKAKKAKKLKKKVDDKQSIKKKTKTKKQK
jgi:hypothetical protein